MDPIKRHFEENAQFYLGNQLKEQIWQKRRPMFERLIDPDRPYRFLDAGGGTGFLSDKILETFPKAEVTLVDLSQALLDRNRPHERKRLVCRNLHEFFADESEPKFDFINLDVLLHHILSVDSYGETRRIQSDFLAAARQRLEPDGHMSIRELDYQSLPGLPPNSTHRLLWFATTRKLPRVLSRTLHRLGMQSQGAGACFFSRSTLLDMLTASGYEVEDVVTFGHQRMGLKHYLALAGEVKDIYIMARPATASGPA